MSRTIYVDASVEVGLSVEDILDGTTDQDLAHIKDAQQRLSGRKTAVATGKLGEAVERRHYTDHDGPGWLCGDPVCAAWEAER